MTGRSASLNRSLGRLPSGALLVIRYDRDMAEKGDTSPRVVRSVPDARLRRIMVIDDEPLLGQTLRLAFEGKYEVVVATSGEIALALLERESDFDLLLCDLKMPALSGIEVYERAVARRPELAERFVFMTGGALTPEASAFLARHPEAQIEKPFDILQLEALLARPKS